MRRYLLILLAVVGALAGVAALSLFRSPTLGLDLQGGLEVILQAEAPRGQEVDEPGMDRSIEIMRSRIDKLGVAEPEIRQQGTDQIIVELPGVHDAGRAAEIVGTTAQLEFYDLEGDVVPPSRVGGAAGGLAIQPNESPLPLLTPEDKLEGSEEPNAWYLFAKKEKEKPRELLGGPADTKEELLQSLEGDPPEGAQFFVVPSDRIVLSCGEVNTRLCPGGGNGAFPPDGKTIYYYLFEYQPTSEEDPVPELTGKDLRLQGTQQDFDRGQPIVTLEFNDSGGDKFHDITRELAQRGRRTAITQGIPTDNDSRQAALQRFAIVLDREIRSFPTIDFVDNPDGIAGGRAQITGLDDVGEAKDLALVLQTGALPYTFNQLERTDISATLGEDSLRQALIAGIGGILAVALFLLLVYRFLGVVAIIGLAIYGAFLYGTILLFGQTLTLPGFAGLILTIGVAADANIVIFERIKEEVRAGKSVRAAIGAGYRKGFATIVDGNVVTMITAAVLFLIGTGGVRGFALMLLLGTLMSMLTAVLATRALLGVLQAFRWFDNPVFMGASGQKIPAWQRIDFIGRWKLWFALSGVVLLVSAVSLGLQGLNLGIDFRGGSQATFETNEPIPVDRVREEAAAIGQGGAVIQGRGEAKAGGFTNFSVKTESLARADQDRLQSGLEDDLNATNFGFKNVSASFSQQILKSALIAIVVSLFLIVLYVSFRYQFAYSVPVLVAMAHDVLIAVGVYSLSGREVTAASVAALLTILGYSIYDTIIIFDRVRENVGIMKRSSFAAIANQSLWETIRRSLATTFIALLPVASLFVFGGATLKDFAFAILIGVGSGAYSTIFIATPLLSMLKERDPEYAKRKSAGLVEKAELSEPEPPPPAEIAPAPVPVAEVDEEALVGDGAAAAAAARRDARRKRRRARPHGRAR
ncbi:MAG: protein translocase subunit SecD [Actinobacteria bacterium]|nr:protein translocase subunit SecD [Actinomycetota bacterium]